MDTSEYVFVSTVDAKTDCIQVFDPNTGANIRSFRGNCLSPNTLCPVGNCEYLLAAKKDKSELQIWALNQHEPVQKRFPVRGRVNVLDVSPSGEKYCAVALNEKIFVYSLRCGKILGTINRHYQDVTCIKYTSCGNYFASASNDGFVYLWSKASLIDALHKKDQSEVQPYYILGQHSDKITNMSITDTGMRGQLITCSLDYTAKVFDLIYGTLRYNIIFNCALTSVFINCLGSQAFFGGAKGKVWGLNLLPHPSTSDIQITHSGTNCHESAVNCVSLTLNGRTLITGGEDGELKVWSVVVINEKNSEKVLSFAFQRSLLTKRGPISNVLLMIMNAEIFNAVELTFSEVLSSFSVDNNESILDCKVILPPNKSYNNSIDKNKFLQLAAELLKPKKRITQKKKKRDGLKELKEKNDQFYKYCLENILGE